MNRYTDEERQLDELLRSASPRRTVPPGLDTRIMARIAAHERRRRERRAIRSMALTCLALSAVLAVVGGIAVRSLDVVHRPETLVLLLAGMGCMALTVGGDRIGEIMRRL